MERSVRLLDQVRTTWEYERQEATLAHIGGSPGFTRHVRQDNFRSGMQAITYATRACELTGWADDRCLDTLATAYAEADDFDRAIEWQERAIKLAPKERKAGYRARLQLFEAGGSYREPALPKKGV